MKMGYRSGVDELPIWRQLNLMSVIIALRMQRYFTTSSVVRVLKALLKEEAQQERRQSGRPGLADTCPSCSELLTAVRFRCRQRAARLHCVRSYCLGRTATSLRPMRLRVSASSTSPPQNLQRLSLRKDSGIGFPARVGGVRALLAHRRHSHRTSTRQLRHSPSWHSLLIGQSLLPGSSECRRGGVIRVSPNATSGVVNPRLSITQSRAPSSR